MCESYGFSGVLPRSSRAVAQGLAPAFGSYGTQAVACNLGRRPARESCPAGTQGFAGLGGAVHVRFQLESGGALLVADDVAVAPRALEGERAQPVPAPRPVEVLRELLERGRAAGPQ